MGDLNINYLNNTDHCEIRDIFLLHGLMSLIDVIFVKETSRIAKSEVLLMSMKDHDMIGRVYKMNNIRFNGRTIRLRDCRNYNPEQLQKKYS